MTWLIIDTQKNKFKIPIEILKEKKQISYMQQQHRQWQTLNICIFSWVDMSWGLKVEAKNFNKIKIRQRTGCKVGIDIDRDDLISTVERIGDFRSTVSLEILSRHWTTILCELGHEYRSSCASPHNHPTVGNPRFAPTRVWFEYTLQGSTRNSESLQSLRP